MPDIHMTAAFCPTCGRDTDTGGDCAVCIQWWKDNPPSPDTTPPLDERTPRLIAKELSKSMHCNCDLDNWTPEPSTGHSWVCRIHKAAMSRLER